MTGRTRRDRAVRWTLAAVFVVTAGAVVRPSPSDALGPVIAASVDEVAVPVSRVGANVTDTAVSGRGEAVAFHDLARFTVGAALLDTPGAEPISAGYGATISGDGCVVLRVQDGILSDFNRGVAFHVSNRCTGRERDIAYTNGDYDVSLPVALSYDGTFALVQVRPPVVIGFRRGGSASPVAQAPQRLGQVGPIALNPARSTIFRIDAETYGVLEMPLPPNASGHNAAYGFDISDDGQTVVAPVWYRTPAPYGQEIALWDIPSGGVSTVSNPSGAVAFSLSPSVSADARYVAFASTARIVGGETGNGPWVYVLDRVTGAYARPSNVADPSYYTSISGDGSQVAYAVGPRGCVPNVIDIVSLRAACPPGRIDVAYSPAPGLGAGVQVETVSVDVNNRVIGVHGAPNLSRNGRWVTWATNSANALLGQSRAALNGFQAVVRRRDPGLTVDAFNFGALLNGNVATGQPVVRNTGRTSVYVERVEVGGPGFTVVGGGTCAIGLSLPPGATCTVNVRYQAPATPGTYAGTILVGEAGYDPVVATNSLSGQSTATPPPPTTTTTTTTTVPGQVLLDIQPPLVDYGQVAVGFGSVIRTITVTNTGNRPASLTTVMGGTHPDDFFVSQNGCNGITLAVGASCTMDVLMVALAGGNRTATLSVEVPAVGSVDVVLQGQGRFSPRLLASPSAITERGLTTIVGQGFPADQPVTVIVGTSGLVFTVQPDGLGMFRIPLAAFPDLTLGSYVVRVDARADVYELVQTPLIVQLPTFQPQGPGGPVFGDAILVTRGGG